MRPKRCRVLGIKRERQVGWSREIWSRDQNSSSCFTILAPPPPQSQHTVSTPTAAAESTKQELIVTTTVPMTSGQEHKTCHDNDSLNIDRSLETRQRIFWRLQKIFEKLDTESLQFDCNINQNEEGSIKLSFIIWISLLRLKHVRNILNLKSLHDKLIPCFSFTCETWARRHLPRP